MIVFDDVYKRYKTEHGPGDWVLEGVSFVIPKSANVGVIGGNGAGKSTLLRLIAAADKPTRGNIERHCRVSWIMGFGGGLQKALTGRQNAKFVCRVHGHEDDLEERLEMIKSFADIGDKFDEQTGTYSSGMQARLKFALSLAFDFDIYISDELTAVGDLAFKEKARAAFKKLTGQAGLIMVAHQEATLKEFCSSGILVADGKAHWFDDIDDALRMYHENVGASEEMPIIKKKKAFAKNNESELFSSEEDMDNSSSVNNAPRTNESFRVLLEQGIRGEPVTLDYEDGQKFIQYAKQNGLTLLRIGQFLKHGYRLKPNMSPIMCRRHPEFHDKIMEFYDLFTQGEKVKGVDE